MTRRATDHKPPLLRRIASSIVLHLALAAAFGVILVTAFCGWPF
jgi:hypothetical protein